MNRPGSLFPQFAEKRAALRNAGILTGVGVAGLIPALVLVAAGFSHRQAPAALVHPALVFGGLAASVASSFVAATHWEMNRSPGHVHITCTIRKRTADLVILATSVLLLLIIVGYLFNENFQAR